MLCQPPAPKLSGPPIMTRPQPWSWVLLRSDFLLLLAQGVFRLVVVHGVGGHIGQDDAVEVAQQDCQAVLVLGQLLDE